MKNLLILLIASFVSLGCSKTTEPTSPTPSTKEAKAGAKAPPVQLERMVGDGFSASLPPGYTVVSKETLKEIVETSGNSVAGAAQLLLKEGGFVSSIVVIDIPSAEVDPRKDCERSAADLAKAAGAELKVAPKLVTFGFGETCQFEMGGPKQYAIQTIAYIDKRFWVVVCNMDPANVEQERKACVEFLTGFR